jgi:HTH-type transcriptional regulator / antitoxin HigA
VEGEQDGKVPARVFPISKHIKDALNTRGWTQADLAFVMGRKPADISNLMLGRKQLSTEIAQELGIVFGGGAEHWLQLDNAYRLSLTDNVDEAVVLRSKLWRYPIKEMLRRGWIAETRDTRELEGELKLFLDDDIDPSPVTGMSYETPLLPFQASFKRTIKESALNGAEKAWVARARQLAKACPAADFAASNIPSLKAHLRRLAAKTQAVQRVPEVLSSAGIRYVVVEPLPNVKIDGAAFWVDANSPVIAMSLRFDNIGSFWFALMHEVDHIEHKDSFSFDNLELSPEDAAEKRANANAAEILVPRQELENFIRAYAPRYTETRINLLATHLQIHPGIIVGQLQFRREISYAAHRKLLTKVREIVTRFAFTDGWGQPIPQLGS